ncbi:hypothetical protein [Streptomyces gibsoniae]|uniref:Uncharacterized protein n=1 Tax=Streptomyces gibsoniae TaxID=3075529 RepID=A0ABU2U2H4_9ACTN|nr:hypothetical protein [Streptomyces sp. DSM 41699]MDT0467417.1 hypothetical protein [Streptomyces sp. DSM 41699]
MSLRDFLTRFRPTGAPGAAVTGVPADRAAERAAELDAPLTLLTDVQQEAAAIRVSADRAAAAIRESAARQAAGIVAAARSQAPQVRQEATTPFRRAAVREAEELRAAGERAASLVHERARERMTAMVERAVADALRSACGPGGAP